MKIGYFFVIGIIFLLLCCHKEMVTVKEKNNEDVDTTIGNGDIDTTLCLHIGKINPSGYLKKDGKIILGVNGGTKPYKIKWFRNSRCYDTIFNNWNLENLGSGLYFLMINDSMGRSIKDSVYLVSLSKVEPKEYLPVYPNSYWIYSNGDTIKSGPEYKKVPIYYEFINPYYIPCCCSNGQYFNLISYPDDSLYLPVWNGRPILNYNKVNPKGDGTISMEPQIDTVRLRKTIINLDHRHGSVIFKTQLNDTTLQIGENTFNHVIISVVSYDGEGHPPGAFFIKSYYAPGVGLVKEVRNDNFNGLIKTKDLIKWSIVNDK